MLRIPKPEPDEYLACYCKYLALVGDDAMAALRSQAAGTPRLLQGVDETTWVPAAGFDRRPLPELVAQCEAVRAPTLALFGSFNAGSLTRRGSSNYAEVSVRALAHIIAGHELHHVSLRKERYAVA